MPVTGLVPRRGFSHSAIKLVALSKWFCFHFSASGWGLGLCEIGALDELLRPSKKPWPCSSEPPEPPHAQSNTAKELAMNRARHLIFKNAIFIPNVYFYSLLEPNQTGILIQFMSFLYSLPSKSQVFHRNTWLKNKK